MPAGPTPSATAASFRPPIPPPPPCFDYRAAVLADTRATAAAAGNPALAALVDSGALVRVPRRRFGPVPAWRPPDFVEPEEVWILGTSHLSMESVADVERVLRAVRPDNVVVELCRSRQELRTLASPFHWSFLVSALIDAIAEPSLQSWNHDEKTAVSPYELYEKLSASYPSLLQPLIHERDMFLAWSLKRSKAVNKSKTVVGVVGKGHMNGIVYALISDQGDLRFRDLVSRASSDTWVTSLIKGLQLPDADADATPISGEHAARAGREEAGSEASGEDAVSLPAHLVDGILCYLSPLESARVATVCKSWAGIVSHRLADPAPHLFAFRSTATHRRGEIIAVPRGGEPAVSSRHGGARVTPAHRALQRVTRKTECLGATASGRLVLANSRCTVLFNPVTGTF
ncbi:hypothetical protein BAE44_0007732 [Dichanthelium oligosanthes]|uniref:TraB domain-containing protein n=1 Tax=Dichanthelium oligosanthes TaxID=888268 RepID=A0A1E5W1P3_9POAL|nr:hypothetical protein BAE44_0007732 [Dichanthelium oligosanthes]